MNYKRDRRDGAKKKDERKEEKAKAAWQMKTHSSRRLNS